MMAMVRISSFIVVLLLCLSQQVGGIDNCPAGSSNLIRMCRPVTITNRARYTMEFTDFESTAGNIDRCHCSFIAPSRGEFQMSPTSFIGVNSCGTQVVISINNVAASGGTIKCTSGPFADIPAYPGDNITVTISQTLSSAKIAPYCYVATFPVNVTFTCTSAFPNTATTTPPPAVPTTTTTTPPTTTTTPPTTTTTPPTTTTTPPTTRTTTTSPTTKVSSSSLLSMTATNPSSSSNLSTAEDGIPMTIVIPAAVGGAVLIILVIIVAVVCSRRSKFPKQTTGEGYQNEVFNDKDSSSDGIKDNVLYNSMDANYSDMNGGSDGHYSSVIRHSTKLDEDSHKMKELPQSANQEPQGPVYAVVDKGQKRPSGPSVANKPSVAAQSENANAPVYAVPDKSQSKAKQSQNALYDVPKNNSPVASPVRTSNQDGLLYSEIEHVGQIPELPSRKSDPKPNDTVVYSEVRTEL